MRYILLLVFLCTGQASQATFQMTALLEEVYSDLLALKVEKGKKVLQNELISSPENGVAIYLENYIDFIQLMITEDRQLYGQIANNESKRLKKIAVLENTSPYYLFCQAEIKLQWAFIKLKFGEELSAAWHIRQAYKLLEENEKKFPGFLPNKKSLGLLHVLIGSVPEKYMWVIHTVGMRGSIGQGLAELQTIQQSNLPYALEAALLLNIIHIYILKSEKQTLFSLQRLYQSYPDNLLVHFIYASGAMKEGQSELALRILQNTPSGDEYIPFHLLTYKLAEIYLQKGLYMDAIRHYNLFLFHYKGQNFLKDSYFKLFLAHWLNGKDQLAGPYLNQVLQKGHTVAEADKYAQKFAETRKFPHKSLMKSRLSFDGGYYSQAMQLLKDFTENSFLQAKDKAEFNYRKARIHHKTGQTSEALLAYKRTIKLSEEEQYYFGANAALQAGYLYQEAGNLSLARQFFVKALSFKKHEYKDSIDNKAKAALNALEEK